jgi:hypothetical protein
MFCFVLLRFFFFFFFSPSLTLFPRMDKEQVVLQRAITTWINRHVKLDAPVVDLGIESQEGALLCHVVRSFVCFVLLCGFDELLGCALPAHKSSRNLQRQKVERLSCPRHGR